MTQNYNFGIGKAGIVFSVRTIKDDPQSVVGSGVVASYGVGSVEVAIDVTNPANLYFIRDSDSLVFGFAEYAPANFTDDDRAKLVEMWEIVTDRLGPSVGPPGPVDVIPSSPDPDKVTLCVSLRDLTLDPSIPVKGVTVTICFSAPFPIPIGNNFSNKRKWNAVTNDEGVVNFFVFPASVLRAAQITDTYEIEACSVIPKITVRVPDISSYASRCRV